STLPVRHHAIAFEGGSARLFCARRLFRASLVRHKICHCGQLRRPATLLLEYQHGRSAGCTQRRSTSFRRLTRTIKNPPRLLGAGFQSERLIFSPDGRGVWPGLWRVLPWLSVPP